MKREIEVDRFPVKTDNGKEYIIVQYQTYVSDGTFDNPQSEIATVTSFLTLNGDIVNQIDSKTFQIIDTNQIPTIEIIASIM